MQHHRALGRILGAVVALSALAAACSGSGSDATEIQPIEPILASDISITADPAGTSAVLEVDTSIPVVCAVVYGPDESFGSIATDDDMSGGAHQDHHPRMTGLTPDTEYLFVLQGVDADGAIYRSETLTFRTPVPVEGDTAAAAGPGVNLAVGATVSGASSSFSSAFDASLAVDGDLTTEWSSAGDGDDAWIEIDLGSAAEVSGFGLRSREMSDGSSIIETYIVTVDGSTELGPFPAGVGLTVSEADTAGQRFRFDADTTTGGNTGAVEIEIYRAE